MMTFELQDRADVDLVLFVDDADVSVASSDSFNAPFAIESVRIAGRRVTMMLRQRSDRWWLSKGGFPNEATWRIRLNGRMTGESELVARARIVSQRWRGVRVRLVLEADPQWDKRTQTF